ncbi:MAG: UbiX family flavin prenyltransferase [Rubrivivax sp.]|nr:UbiX family flavin prenyltransferase [Rubrivivax sp.]
MATAPTPVGTAPRRIIIGISGASGSIYGIRLLELLREVPGVETHLVLSSAGKLTLALETGRKVPEVLALAHHVHDERDIGASIASGSFRTAGMVVAPCSMRTLSAIVHSLSDNLLTRAADVVLKEQRRLVLMPRESPLHLGHCRLLVQAAELGALIVPPMPAFYAQPQTLQDIVDHSVGRVLDLFDIDSGLVKRWQGVGATVAAARGANAED